MTVKLHIDGVPVEYEASGGEIFRMGTDVNGRWCRVQVFRIKTETLDWLRRNKRAITTCGYRFEFKEVKE